MEHLLTSIIGRLESVGGSLGLSYIDEEYGQVEFLDYEDRDTYPVTFPCVLVDCQGEQWAQVGDGMQRGVATVNVNVYIDCYDDTHAFIAPPETVEEEEIGEETATISATAGKADCRMALVRSVTEYLQGWSPLEEGRTLTRVSTSTSTLNHHIKLYQIAFTVPVYESFAPARRSHTPQGMKLNVKLKTPNTTWAQK
ncbi:MAG: hypothetical protein VZQ98_12310 [Bacteroidales bacterium]|nr:hypothetical protein [Bacteroidales bacterium]